MASAVADREDGDAARTRRADTARGVITVAFGSGRYVRLAKALARSLELHAPHLPRAIVTDSDDRELRALYDHCLPYQPEWGLGFEYKFYLNDYSPFRQTLYLDCDCLVVRDIDHVWETFTGVPFGVEGRQVSTGRFEGDVASMCRRLGVDSIPRFNGGMYYFDDSDRARAVFHTARELMARYDELGLDPMARGFSSDEPVVAMALATHGIRAVDDHGQTMRTPIGIRGPLDIDILRGYCRFNKAGTPVTPAIPHFADWRTRAFHYNREAAKLWLSGRLPVPDAWISTAVNAVSNPVYALVHFFGRPLLPLTRRVYRAWAYR